MRTLSLIALSLVFLITSCELEYGDNNEDSIGQSIPNFSLTNLDLKQYEQGQLSYQVRAEKAQVFNKKDETILTATEYTSFDRNGEIEAQGKAESATYLGKTDSAEMQGTIELISVPEESTITTDYLYWDGSKKRLFSKEDTEVTITQDGGSSFAGKGFNADMKNAKIRFENGVTGVLVLDDEQ